MILNDSISLNSVIFHNEGNVVSDMDGEKVMMSIHNGKYYNLGEIGGVIWDLMKSPISVNQLINILRSEYAVGKNECEEQVIAFLELLYKEKLIQIQNEV